MLGILVIHITIEAPELISEHRDMALLEKLVQPKFKVSPDHTTNKSPYLLVAGIEGDIKKHNYDLRKRGFIPRYALQQGSKCTMVLSLSPKLFTKLAIKYGYPIRTAANSSDGDVTRIVYQSRKIVKRSGIKFESAWLLHQAEKVSIAFSINTI